MIKLAKYLKPYVFMIIICIVLLFINANMDLALPDYMSRIVNTGIQQGGIESPVPTALRESTMSKLSLFIESETMEKISTVSRFPTVFII